MLMHHSSQNYEEAASDAARRYKDKLYAQIDRGRRSGQAIIEKVMTEVPTDKIVRSRALRFDGSIDDRPRGAPLGLTVDIPIKNSMGPATQGLSLHRHAKSQTCYRAGVPWKYAQWLEEPDRSGWGTPLLARNLNEIYSHIDSKYLMRSYGGQLRGFLSDRYRRMDSRPLLEAFAGSCQEIGAVPIEGYGTDTKVGLKAILPLVFEPVPNEVLSIGAMWENSDYGNGKHSIWIFVNRLACTNYMITSTGFAQVHLGKRLTEDMSFSQRTYELDTATIASAIKDVVSTTLAPDSIHAMCQVIRNASEQEIQPEKALKALGKKLTKSEIGKVTDRFNQPDVVELPPGNSAWRLSNALSWVANDTEDVERKVDLMKVAGTVVMDVAQSSAIRS